jgi:hypothetical protein
MTQQQEPAAATSPSGRPATAAGGRPPSPVRMRGVPERDLLRPAGAGASALKSFRPPTSTPPPGFARMATASGGGGSYGGGSFGGGGSPGGASSFAGGPPQAPYWYQEELASTWRDLQVAVDKAFSSGARARAPSEAPRSRPPPLLAHRLRFC